MAGEDKGHSKRNPGGTIKKPKYDRDLLEKYPELSAEDYYKPTRRGGGGNFPNKPKGRAKSAPDAPMGKPKAKPKTAPKAKPRLWGGRKKLPGDPSLKKNKPKAKTKPTPKTKPKPKTAPKAKSRGNSPMNFGKAARNRQKSRIYET